MLRTLILLVCLLPWSASAYAQHTPLTSQYLFNGLLINPAYAGSRDALTASLTHRQQWVGFTGAPVTHLLSVHAPLNKRKVGVGLMVFNDRIGVSNETGFMTNYAYRIKFPKGRLAFGIGAGMTVLRSDWGAVALQDGNDAAFMATVHGVARPNFSTGVYYYSNTWFAGASVPFLLLHRHDVSQDGLVISQAKADLQPMVTGGYLFRVSDNFKLKPSTLLRYRAETGPQADISAHAILRDRLWLGCSYRSGDAFIAMIEVLPTDQWRIGYAYDMGLSRLRAHHLGSHGVMIQYEFGYAIRARDPRHF